MASPQEQQVVIAGGVLTPMADLVFSVEDVQFVQREGGKRFLSFVASAEAEHCRCGFAVDMLLTGWLEEELCSEPRLLAFRGDIRFRSIGFATENFISRLENAFGLGSHRDQLFEKLFCECVGLNSDPRLIEENEFVGRVFFGDGSDPGADASLFIYIDLQARSAWFVEKDISYRQAIVAWFRGKYQ